LPATSQPTSRAGFIFKAGPADRLAGAQPQLLRGQALDGTGPDAAKLARQDRSFDTAHDCVCHVLLQGKGVLERTVEPLGPDPLALRGIAQLHVDPHARPGAPDASIEQITCCGIRAGVHDPKGGKARERRGDLGDQPVGSDLQTGIGSPSNSATLATTLFHPAAAGSPCQAARSAHWIWSKDIDGTQA
jgi:hypothetical protein